jgi:hypothetical protein
MVGCGSGIDSGQCLYHFLRSAYPFKIGMMNQMSNTIQTTPLSYEIEPTVNQKEALHILRKQKGFFSRKRELIKLESVFLPIYIFNVVTEDKKGKRIIHEVAVDAVEGQFALILTAPLRKNMNAGFSILPFSLNPFTAADIAKGEFRNHMFRFRPGILIKDVSLCAESWYPYWIGYYKSKKGFFFEAIDGCNGKFQGVKMKSLFSKVVLQKAG